MNVQERKELLDRLPDGMYVLREAVTNPAADKRERHDWRKAPLWNAGMRFVLRTVDEGCDASAPFWLRELLADRHPYAYDNLSVRPNGMWSARKDNDLKRLDALLPAMMPDTSRDALLRWAFRRAGFNLNDGPKAADVLRTLVLNSKVSLSDVECALHLADEEAP